MNKCKDCQKYNTCSTREVFGSLSCNDGFVPKKQTNADKIRSLNDEELAKFLSETTNCEFCKVQCDDRHSLPTVDSCKYRFKEWLQSEVDNGN